MDPDPSLPDNVKMILMSFEAPANLPLARELWIDSACDTLGEVTIPTLVLIGGRDIQIDVHADGDPLHAVAAGMPNVSFAFPPNANHVFKEETRSAAEVAAAPGAGYNDPDAHLDPESLTTIVTWLETIFHAPAPARG
jgi:hypothetical protein